MDLINGRVTRFRFATDPDRFSAYAVLDHSSKSAKNLFGPALERTAQDAEGRK
jgi:delta-aminolevulinic acid dehydratase/porphobilinogen synthase